LPETGFSACRRVEINTEEFFELDNDTIELSTFLLRADLLIPPEVDKLLLFPR
jgi:hypothetical protein